MGLAVKHDVIRAFALNRMSLVILLVAMYATRLLCFYLTLLGAVRPYGQFIAAGIAEVKTPSSWKREDLFGDDSPREQHGGQRGF